MDNAEQRFTKNVCSAGIVFFIDCNLGCRSSYGLAGGRMEWPLAIIIITHSSMTWDHKFSKNKILLCYG